MEQNRHRRSIFEAALALYPHDVPADIPKVLERYAIVSQHEDAFGHGGGYWFLTSDDADRDLRASTEDIERHGYVPFLVIDLDTGCSYHVQSICALGALSNEPRHDFTSAAVVDVDVDRSPRTRASVLAERVR
jgi:hypothetical protein